MAAAWVGNVAWGALPDAGIIVTLDGPPETRVVGRAVRLSHQRIYRQDGSAVNYGGGAAGGVLGFPQAVLTGGDGEEYALVGGDLERPGNPPTLLSAGAQAYLYRLPGRGAATSNVPTVQTDQGLYRLTGAQLERLDARGPHGGRPAARPRTDRRGGRAHRDAERGRQHPGLSERSARGPALKQRRQTASKTAVLLCSHCV